MDTSLPIEQPLHATDDFSWDRDCDLLVLGCGAAGSAAAITAAEAGQDVLIADRFNNGGATARSGGVVYAGGGTEQQKAAGYDDTPEAMLAYLRHEVGDAVRPETLQRFCADSRELIRWLESLGACFGSNVPPPKTSYPPDGCYLYYSGNESVSPYADDATPAPRGHRTVDNGLSGRKLYSHLRGRVDALDLPVLADCAARRLIVDDAGAVLGAELWQMPADAPATRKYRKLIRRAEWLHNLSAGAATRLRGRALALELQHATPLRVRARRGVLIATGGFIFNESMLKQHAPAYQRTMRLGTSGCEGSGIRLGLSVGAATDRMHKISAWRFINPPAAWPLGIVVGPTGERYCNEASYGARLGVAMCEQQDGRSWLILDRAQRRAAYRQALFGGLWFFQSLPALLLMLFAPRERSLEALAKRIKLPAKALEQAVAENNAAALAGLPDAVGKSGASQCALVEPPFAALNISVDNPSFPCPAITLGGLRVDEETGAVVGDDGQAIQGLYAAGRAAVGIASNGYVSGLSLADCLWSGRRAGRAVAQPAES